MAFTKARDMLGFTKEEACQHSLNIKKSNDGVLEAGDREKYGSTLYARSASPTFDKSSVGRYFLASLLSEPPSFISMPAACGGWETKGEVEVAQKYREAMQRRAAPVQAPFAGYALKGMAAYGVSPVVVSADGLTKG